MDIRIHLDVISWVLTEVSWVHALFSWVLFIVPCCTISVLRIVETAFSLFRFHFSVCPSKLITKAHCNILAGGADAAAVRAVAFVGDVLKRCIEQETTRELQRCAQVKCEPRR